MARGEVLPLERAWALARGWYGDHLEPGYRGRSAAETAAVLRGVGLEAPFWSVEGDV